MRKLSVFNFMTLDGYFKGLNEDISWHRHGEEENAYAAEGAQSESTLLFGRVTYEMMAGFWPTPVAMQNAPLVAVGMNKSEKIVFSRTLKNAEWNNTRIVKENIIEEVIKLKKQTGNPLTLLGSGSILTQLAEHGLIDEFQLMVDPVALGAGTPILKGIKETLHLQLTSSKIFKSGVILLCYRALDKEIGG